MRERAADLGMTSDMLAKNDSLSRRLGAGDLQGGGVRCSGTDLLGALKVEQSAVPHPQRGDSAIEIIRAPPRSGRG